MGTNKIVSEPTRRRRRVHSPEFKAELVAICQQPGVSMAAVALNHGINANLLRRWVTEHERYGKHSLSDEGHGSPVAQTRDMSPANWLAISPPRSTASRQVVAQAPDKIIVAQEGPTPASSTIALELAGCGIHLTLQWPAHDATGLAQFARAVLT